MKNGIVFYQDGTKKVISAENDKFMALIRENIRFDNNDIVVAERQEDGSFISHWDRIYPSLNNGNN